MLQLQSYMKCEEEFTSRKKIVSLEILYKTISSCVMSLCDEVKTQPGNSVKLILLGQCCAVLCCALHTLFWFYLFSTCVVCLTFCFYFVCKIYSSTSLQIHQFETITSGRNREGTNIVIFPLVKLHLF